MESVSVECLNTRLATDVDAQRWDNFLAETGCGAFYHRYGWMKIIREAFGHEVFPMFCENSSGDIVGVLPLVFLNSRLFGKILCSMPFLNYGGTASLSGEIERTLVDAARDTARELAVDFLEIRSRQRLEQSGLSVSTAKVSMTIDLDRDPDVLWDGFSSKHRTAIRRAYKNGLSVVKGGSDLVPDFYRLLSLSWKALGTPLYREDFFDRIAQVFSEDLELFLCVHNGVPIAAAMNGVHGATVEGMWLGVAPGGRKVQYSYVLYWEMIRDACELGRNVYHLGRSTADSGGEGFKKKWNSRSEQLYWHYDLINRSDLPELNVTNPKFEMAIRLWRRLPMRVTDLIGPAIASGIP